MASKVPVDNILVLAGKMNLLLVPEQVLDPYLSTSVALMAETNKAA